VGSAYSASVGASLGLGAETSLSFILTILTGYIHKTAILALLMEQNFTVICQSFSHNRHEVRYMKRKCHFTKMRDQHNNQRKRQRHRLSMILPSYKFHSRSHSKVREMSEWYFSACLEPL